jgi:hypothetical protein
LRKLQIKDVSADPSPAGPARSSEFVAPLCQPIAMPHPPEPFDGAHLAGDRLTIDLPPMWLVVLRLQ